MLRIPETDGNCLLEPGSILRVKASSNYCIIYFTNQQKQLVVSKVLRWVQERLPAEMFLRVHRSHLVNRMHVQQVKGSLIKSIQLTNGDYVPVSRRKRGVLE